MAMRGNGLVVFGLVALAVLSRWLPHPPNFSPLIGIALFAGARFDSKTLAVGVPLIAMLISDLVLGWHSTLPFVYGCLMILALIGWRALKPAGFGWKKLGATSTFGAVLFFVISNFGVWLTQDLYSYTLTGLVACFAAAIPFFPATLASGWVYAFALFALSSIADMWVERLALTQVKTSK